MKLVAVIAAIVAAAVAVPAAGAADSDVAVPAAASAADGDTAAPPTVEGARSRFQYLRQQGGVVEKWVEENWEREFAERYPKLSRRSRRADETVDAFRSREMQARIAVAELKARLRVERKTWVENERKALLGREIREPLPVRLGPYDPDRGVYPLLLGFGWPTGVIVTLRVPEREKDAFAARFPAGVPAVFRINEREEVYLVSLAKETLGAEASIFVAQAGPRLLWRGAHESWVTAVSLRSDGAQAVSAGGDGVLSGWDAETGNRIWRLTEVEMALSLSHRPGDSAFATGGTDGFVRMRDGETARELWRARASGMVCSVAFSPNGRFVVSGDDGGSLRVWNADTGNEVLRADLGAQVLSVDYSADGRSVLAGTDEGNLVLWEAITGRQLWKVAVGGPVYSVAVSPGGDFLAAAAAGEIRVFLASDFSEAWRRKADGEVRALRFDPSGLLLAYGGSGYSAHVLSAQTGESMWAASVGSPIRALAFGPQGKKLIVGSADFGVRFFAVDEGDRVQVAISAFGPIYVERDRASRLFR